MKTEIKEFLKKVSNDATLKEVFKNVKTKEEVVKVANKNGFNLTEKDFEEAVENLRKKQKGDGAKLSMEELEKVVGGVSCGCFMYGEGSGDTKWGNFGCFCWGGGTGTFKDSDGHETGYRTDGYCWCSGPGAGGTGKESSGC